MKVGVVQHYCVWEFGVWVGFPKMQVCLFRKLRSEVGLPLASHCQRPVPACLSCFDPFLPFPLLTGAVATFLSQNRTNAPRLRDLHAASLLKLYLLLLVLSRPVRLRFEQAPL